jgi:hypothetical protein
LKQALQIGFDRGVEMNGGNRGANEGNAQYRPDDLARAHPGLPATKGGVICVIKAAEHAP